MILLKIKQTLFKKGFFAELVLYSFYSYLSRLGASDSDFFSKIYASFPFAFYILWVLVGIINIIKSVCLTSFGYHKMTMPYSGYYALTIIAWITSYLVIKNYSKYDGLYEFAKKHKFVKYQQEIGFSFILIIPLPLMLALSRDSPFLMIFMIIAHWTYLVVVGSLLISRVTKIKGISDGQ